MRDGQRKQYSKGDQIHFIVTEDFVEVANDFVIFCDKNAMNVSRVIRDAITEWLHKKQILEKRLEKLEHGTASMQDFADAYERDVLKEV
jgi:ribosomal silencing factor RsfS